MISENSKGYNKKKVYTTKKIDYTKTLSGEIIKTRYSYAVSWEAYVKGNIVSKTSARYIQNLLAATAATKTEDSEDSSDDTDAEQYENFDFKAGSMALVHQTLKGMSANNMEEGLKAMGRHARTIRLGRSLWESAPLEPEITNLMQERFFDDGTFPPLKEVKTAVAQAKKSAGREACTVRREDLGHEHSLHDGLRSASRLLAAKSSAGGRSAHG